MSDWYLVLAVFWAVFLLDGLRRSRRATLAVSRTAPFAATARHQAIPALPPAPWAWRFWADDPPFALSPRGLCNQPVGTAGRPAEPPVFTRVWRWEEIAAVTARDGWLWINGERFSPAAAAFPAAELQQLAAELKPLSPDARAARLRRQLHLWFRPAHWRRRIEFARRISRWPALANTLTLAVGAVVSVAVLADALGFKKEMAEALVVRVPRLLLVLAVGYVIGIVLAVLAARRLRRWTKPGVVKAIFGAAVFPPQGLRWRRVLTDACRPAPHPPLIALAGGSRAAREELAFNTLADLRWPVPLPEGSGPAARADPTPEASLSVSSCRADPCGCAGSTQDDAGGVGASSSLSTAAEIRAWSAAEFEPLLRRWLQDAALDAAALLAPPAPDGAASCAYCPRCRSQFVRLDGRCPRGVKLVPLRR